MSDWAYVEDELPRLWTEVEIAILTDKGERLTRKGQFQRIDGQRIWWMGFGDFCGDVYAWRPLSEPPPLREEVQR